MGSIFGKRDTFTSSEGFNFCASKTHFNFFPLGIVQGLSIVIDYRCLLDNRV